MTAARHLDNTPQTPGTPDTVELYFALAARLIMALQEPVFRKKP